MSRNKKLSKKLLILIISVSVALAILAAILITNIFIPVKYLSAYINFSTDKPQNGEMRISFIDVGAGDCTLVELPDGKSVLIDGGNGSYNNRLKILKKLNKCGIDKINYLFCTSAASKRCGGLAEIVKYKKTDKIYAPLHKNYGITAEYRNFRNEVKKKSTYVEECAYGAGIYNEQYGYCFFVLSPERMSSDGVSGGLTVDKIHSSAMWISYAGVNVLLLGDLKTAELQEFYDVYKTAGFEVNGYHINLEECDIVKVASGGDESGEFTYLYDLIKAETAIISTNKEPAHGLMSDIGVYADGKIYRTDKNGTVTLCIGNDGYKVKKER